MFKWPHENAGSPRQLALRAFKPLAAVRGTCGPASSLIFSTDGSRLYSAHGKCLFEFRVLLKMPLPEAAPSAIVDVASQKVKKQIHTQILQNKLTKAQHSLEDEMARADSLESRNKQLEVKLAVAQAKLIDIHTLRAAEAAAASAKDDLIATHQADIAALKHELAAAVAGHSDAVQGAAQTTSPPTESEVDDLRQELSRVEAKSAAEAQKIVDQRLQLSKLNVEVQVLKGQLLRVQTSSKRMEIERQHLLQSEQKAQRNLAKLKTTVSNDLARRDYMENMQASTSGQYAKEQAALRQLLAKQEKTIAQLLQEKEKAMGDVRLIAAEADLLRGNWELTSLQKLSIERLLSLRDTLASRSQILGSAIEEAEAKVHRLLTKVPAALSQQLGLIGRTA